MSATASLALRGGPASLWLPVEAVQPDASGDVVFVQAGRDGSCPRRSPLARSREATFR